MKYSGLELPLYFINWVFRDNTREKKPNKTEQSKHSTKQWLKEKKKSFKKVVYHLYIKTSYSAY